MKKFLVFIIAAVDYDGNTVSGYYKGTVDFFRPR